MTTTTPSAPPIGDHDTTGEPIVGAEMGNAEPDADADAVRDPARSAPDVERDDAVGEDAGRDQTPVAETLTDSLSVQGGEESGG